MSIIIFVVKTKNSKKPINRHIVHYATMNHQGKVTCRGMLIEGTIYERGDTLNEFHRELILMYRPLLDGITTGGWVSLTAGHFNFVSLTMNDPDFLRVNKS